MRGGRREGAGRKPRDKSLEPLVKTSTDIEKSVQKKARSLFGSIREAVLYAVEQKEMVESNSDTAIFRGIGKLSTPIKDIVPRVGVAVREYTDGIRESYQAIFNADGTLNVEETLKPENLIFKTVKNEKSNGRNSL